MAVLHSFGICVILVFIVCQTSSKPQSYGSRSHLTDNQEYLNRKPTPTNEVYPSHAQPPRRSHSRRNSGVLSTTPRHPTSTLAGGVVRPTSQHGEADVSAPDVARQNASLHQHTADSGHNENDELDIVIHQIFNEMTTIPSSAPEEVPRHAVFPKPTRPNQLHGDKSHIKFVQDRIVFPTEPSMRGGATLPPIQPCLDGQTFCERVPGYPTTLVKSLIGDTFALSNMLVKDEIITRPNITQRIDSSDEQSLCVSHEKVVYPQTGQNVDDKWLYIVNVPASEQSIRVETCRSDGEPCQFGNVMYGYESFCKQKYIYRKLLTLDPNSPNPQAQQENMKFPSCCSCHLRVIDGTSARSGFSASTQARPKSRRRRAKARDNDRPRWE